MRRASKVDRNHGAIRDALRQLGATVYDMSAVGRGMPDLLVTHRRYDYWIEVKDGAKVPSARKLTEAQADLHASWKGAPIMVFMSVDDAVTWWTQHLKDWP
jgi:hypothetical protein